MGTLPLRKINNPTFFSVVFIFGWLILITYVPPNTTSRTSGTNSERIETKAANIKPSSLKDGESEEFRLLGCYETGHAIMGCNMHPNAVTTRLVSLFNGYVVTRSHPGQPSDIARETDWSKPERPKIDGSFVKPRPLPYLGGY